ncbi:hypothetical protein PROFUN_02419 [Planoprotostelium fungivorum]|uniref:ABC transporter domain-containing protein n=1 Tax=Planoprotostelium fungivorum TaxID=1890364 RepID=A0A2P6NUT2_9EUKA|nr:hypothetical protein PROFUN_02419 [Planoprotostelium fungivorum]
MEEDKTFHLVAFPGQANSPLVGEGPTPVHIDVEDSVKRYVQTQEELDRQSIDGSRVKDPEKQAEPTERFNLRDYFENSVRTAKEAGGGAKRVGVSVRNLTVVGQGASASVLADLSTPFRFLGNLINPLYWIRNASKVTPTFDILHEVDTFCRDGEMLLVLGRPGSGCSTLLRLMANQRQGYLDVKGSVHYAGVPAEEFGRFSGEAVYTPEEDSHFPILTVRQTLDFALKTKTPGNRLPQEGKEEFREKMFDLLLTMFGMKKQADTLIGNEWVRGLSGGERKRMTIIEAMVGSPAVCCWDCSTRGLDAASALDYTKALRVMTDTMKKTTVASFYQASENIYNQFDKVRGEERKGLMEKVIILEKGRVIYFGPVEKAKDYFISLGFECEPRKSTPDFLTGVTNFQERKIRKGFEDTAPTTSFEFEAAWKKSTQYKEILEEQKQYEEVIVKESPFEEFKQEVKDTRARGARKSSAYTVSFFEQVKALTVRQVQLIWMDKFDLVTRYLSVIAQALIYGSVFFNLSRDPSGGFSRGGAIFSGLIFNAWASQAELPMAFFGRRTLQKHKSYAMYHPAAYHIAQVVADIPVMMTQVVLFSLITYFMWQLSQTAGQYFVHLFTLFIFSMTMANFFRLCANTSPSVYIAQQVMIAVFMIMITYSGYIIPKPKMHPWLGWFYYINVFAFGFQGLFSNEMRNISFDCSGPGQSIPSGEGYTDAAYKTCIMAGAAPGSSFVAGRDHLQKAYEIDVDHQQLNIVIIFLFWITFTVLNMIAMEYLDFTGGGYSHKVYKRGKAPAENTQDTEKEQQRLVQQATDSMSRTLTLKGGVFMWKEMKYTVPVGGGDRLLLDDVEGWIKPGQMTALMGASGAGKTTLLDVLARRKTMGTVSGTVRLNGKPLKIDFERITGYVEQMDVHNPGLTVREALLFSAKLRQGSNVPLEDKERYVETILVMMEMQHLGDALIGTLESGVGISVEERKRLTIGMELVAKPHILFLDEPTSGLDAQSSYNIIKFIRKLADAGMPLVCTIHQPSSVLFEHFDRLLLLAKGGKMAYFGDIGPQSSTLIQYFTKNGVRTCSQEENPAEYMLEAIGAGVSGNTDKDWPQIWLDSEERQTVKDELNRSLDNAEDNKGEEKATEFATGTLYQTWEVYKRMNLVYWRDPYYNIGRLWQSALVGLINGFSFWQLQNSSSDLQSRILCIFQSIILGVMLIFNAMPIFFMQREYFRRDYASKFYSWLPFAVSIVLVELPYLTLAGTLSMVCSYWSAGLDSTPINGFYYWILFVLFLFYCVAFGQAIAAFAMNIVQAMLLLPLLVVFLFLFCGILQPPANMPYFWRSWMYPLDPFRYFLEGFVTDILTDVRVTCSAEDLYVFQPPPNLTCGQYTDDFMRTASGYIQDPNATSDCGYCSYQRGSDFYETIPWTESHRWRDFGIGIAYWVFNILLVVLLVWVSRKPRR